MTKLEKELISILKSPVNGCASDCCTEDGNCEHCKEPVNLHVIKLTALIKDKCEQAFDRGIFWARAEATEYYRGIENTCIDKDQWIRENITNEA